ncbi:methyltransferase domain-containing protein [bacterium]|nr:MAG: methyltransferase domain-containing protein [bacterium]
MKTFFLDYCKCPYCTGDNSVLKLVDPEYRRQEVFSGKLICQSGHSFEIKDYVPDFVDCCSSLPKRSQVYDLLWDAHAKQDYKGRVHEFENKFQVFAKLPGRAGDYFKDKVVLDAGCGQGRFSYLASSLGAKHVICADYSQEALKQAIQSTGNPDNCSFIRADIMQLPLKREFDFIFSMGVLHHTPSTKESYFSIARLLKDGGYVSVYVYGKFTLPLITWPLRIFTLCMPKERILRICDACGLSYDPLKTPVIPIKKVFGSLGRLDFLGLSRLTYEGLTTPYLWEHNLKELMGWFKDSGVEVISHTNIISASGRLKAFSKDNTGISADKT